MENTLRWQGPFILSSIFSLFLVDIPPFSLLIFVLMAALWLLFKKHSISAAIITAICWFFIHSHWAVSWQLPKQQIKKPINIIGVVSNITNHNPETAKFYLRLTTIGDQKIPWYVQPKLRLSWQKPSQHLQLGDTIQVTVKLKPAHGFSNQGGFSYQKWLLLKGVRATGYVVNGKAVNIVKPSSSFRQAIYSKVKQSTAQLPYQGLILALTVGEKHLITDSQWKTVKSTGISHLLAISGLHIGIVFLFGSILAKLLLKLYCYVFNKDHIVPFIALFFGLAAALGYAWLAGFSIPTVRAFLMLCLLVVIISNKKLLNARFVIINTLFVIVLVNPLSLLEPGLWLSFVAVVVIISTFWWFPVLRNKGLGNKGLSGNKLAKYGQSIVKMQMALFIFMVPITILVFNGFSASGAIVNLIAVPWVSFVTVPLALIATVLAIFNLPAELLFALADASLAVLFILLEQPWINSGWVAFQHLPWYSWALVLIFALSLLIPLRRKFRLASILLATPALLISLNLNNDKQWQVHVLDVGQGLSVVVEKNRKILLYDLGPIYKTGFNTVEHVVLPFLIHKGYQQVDYLVISHADSDHAGAHQKLLAQIKVDNIIAPVKTLPKAKRCTPQTLNWQGLTLQLLWPKGVNTPPISSNDSSCVIKISDGNHSVLLTGDISKRVEKQLLAFDAGTLASTILLAPHHGSNSSSTTGFINAVNPQYVVYSAGYLNRYKFPRDEVAKRYQSSAVKQLNTADSGQISFVFNDHQFDVLQARTDILAHWYYNH
jgi:competence protein ComEC